jgi:hypothetical protein
VSFQFARSNSQKSAGPHDLSPFPHGLGILGVLVPHKGLPGLLCRFHVSAIPMSRSLALALPLQTFGQLVEDISAFVYPTALLAGTGIPAVKTDQEAQGHHQWPAAACASLVPL